MSEFTEQKALFHWARVHQHKDIFEKHLFSIPNDGGGGLQNILRGKRMIAQGMKGGTSDVFFAYPVEFLLIEADTEKCRDHIIKIPGLFLEMKDLKKYLEPKQKAFIIAMRSVGYMAFGVQGWDLARELILTYMVEARKLFLMDANQLYFKGVVT